MVYFTLSCDVVEPERLILNVPVLAPASAAFASVAAMFNEPAPASIEVIWTKQSLLLDAPAALEIVSLPSLTVTVLAPSTKCFDDDSAPLTTRMFSALNAMFELG